MKRLLILMLLIVGTAKAQPAPSQIELACPAGTSPLAGGTTVNNITGKFRQNDCVDVFGNVYRNVSGTLAVKTLGSARFASQFTGADCGAKINAADTDLGAASGEIWVDRSCGTTWTTPVSISTLHTLIFIQGGTYLTAQITLANATGIYGLPTASPFVTGNGTQNTTLQQNNNINANPYIFGNGSSIKLENMTFDGNGSVNTTMGPVVNILGANNLILNSSILNGHTHGLNLGDGTAQDRGAGTRIIASFIDNNTGSGIFMNWVTDVFIGSGTSLDNNLRYGIEATGATSIRIINNDFGGNSLGGIKCSGTASFGCFTWTISNNLFKNNSGTDLDIEAAAACGTACGFGWSIVNNLFLGLLSTATANTFSAITSNGTGAHTITGNFINGIPAAPYKYCFNITEPTLNQELADQIVGNQCSGSIATGPITITATTHYTANVLGANINQTDTINVGTISTASNCAQNTVSPAACGSAASGVFAVPATTTSYTVNTTAVTTNSRIFIQDITDNTGIPSAPTCTPLAAFGNGQVSARVAATSFTISLPSTAGTTCFSYWIVN